MTPADERAEQPMSEPWLLANETSVIEAYRHGFDEGRASSLAPMTTWRGLCGHVWDRAVEDTDECPRCSEREARGRVEAALKRLKKALALHVKGRGVDRCERCEAPWPCVEARAALTPSPTTPEAETP